MTTRRIHIAIGLILAGTFLFDCFTPLGDQEFLFHAVPIVLTLWLEQMWAAYLVAGLATLFTYAGWALSPAGIPADVAFLNRTLSVTVFWVVAVLVNRSRAAVLDRNARRLAALVNSSVDAIISQDVDGTITSWNGAAERLFGYDAAERIGHPLNAIMASEQAREEAVASRQLVSGEAVPPYDTVWLHRNGSAIALSLSRSPIRNQFGAVVGMSTIAHDITAKLKTEASYKHSEVTLQAFFESASLMMGVVEILDDDIRNLSVNRAMASFMGTTQEAMRGRTASELGLSREVIRMWLNHYRLCIKEQSPVRFEYEHRNVCEGKADRRSLLATVSLIGNKANGAVRCSFIVDDVTEWRKTEDLLREAHATLEARVAERTAELGSATVRARTLAQRLFEVQEAERRAVAQDLHDEIGQLLTALKLNLQQVQRDGQGTESSMELNESIEISDQLLARVRNLALDLRPSLLDDLGLVPALRWYATRQAERAGWKLQLHLDDTPLTLTSSRNIACFRVVQEAMTNIARHAKATSVALSLVVASEEVRVVVQDDGCGFDVTAMRVRSQQGLSLGMLGMEERVSLVGGNMTIQSTAGQQTALIFSVPLTEPQQEAVSL
ncbi:MAG: PAS domain S-box protein [Nitrospira sp.]|nr:PAS domain S-box protein [Nitrospira sp.]